MRILYSLQNLSKGEELGITKRRLPTSLTGLKSKLFMVESVPCSKTGKQLLVAWVSEYRAGMTLGYFAYFEERRQFMCYTIQHTLSTFLIKILIIKRKILTVNKQHLIQIFKMQHHMHFC